MRVLGITTEGDSGAALIEDGRIVAAVNEERLSRMKLVMGFPRGSIREVLDIAGARVSDLGAVLVADKRNVLIDQLMPFAGWEQLSQNGSGNRVKRAASRFSRLGNRLPILQSGYYAMLAPTFRRRRETLLDILRNEFGVRSQIKFVDHHLAHIASAYYTSGFDDALVVSLDGGGDGLSARVYAVRQGEFHLMHKVPAYHSLGNYYAYVTHLCGFKAMKHEGKITGLAAHGEPIFLPLLRDFVREQDGSFINHAGVMFKAAVAELERRLPADWRREDLAASIQRHFEESVTSFVRYWARKTGLRDIAVAGGVFANVRVNEEVLALPEIDRIFVHPHMSDGGLGAGAALAACVPGVLPGVMERDPRPMEDVYLGRDIEPSDIERALTKHGLAPEQLHTPIEEAIASLLAQGFVVARAAGRMEYGPRALGNRSILYQPTDPSVNDWLNKNLHRTEFMPFAPAILYDERNRCFENIAGGELPAQFMTITFHCTPWMRDHLQGVVHVDGTARPHLVLEDRNPGFYRIIEAFREITGLPAIINTSFNMHGEPIVCSAEDAVRAFLTGDLDYLALGSSLIGHPQTRRRHRIPLTGAGEEAAH
ncbi:MAG: carbamoyltransferase [Anaerolineales bacterium]